MYQLHFGAALFLRVGSPNSPCRFSSQQDFWCSAAVSRRQLSRINMHCLVDAAVVSEAAVAPFSWRPDCMK